MAQIGVFRQRDFDPGAYVVALFHAQQALADTPHRLTLHTFHGDDLQARAEASGVDALLVFGPGLRDLDFLRSATRPSLVCERILEGCSYLAPDNYDMGKTAARHLIELGHTRIADVLPGERATLGVYHGTRLRGFLETCAALGHAVPDERVYFGSKDSEGGTATAARLLRDRPLPTAIYAQNLPMMLGLLHVLQQRTIRVPDEVSIVGTSFMQMNAPEAAEHTSPPITIVTFQKERMGSEGVRYLLDRLEGRTAGLLQALLPGVLVQRASTAPVRAPAEAR
ncbi:MAG: substrate-binding domain-containing protein [Actinobacteria bacterium]|nr:substrate-binding domain-containing protein [Actinomycetota bacterium]